MCSADSTIKSHAIDVGVASFGATFRHICCQQFGQIVGVRCSVEVLPHTLRPIEHFSCENYAKKRVQNPYLVLS